MSDAEQLFRDIANQIVSTNDAALGTMFGKPVVMIAKKAFAVFFKDTMVFKLSEEDHRFAMALFGAELWDPSGKHRPMREWVQVPYEHREHWLGLAASALKHVQSTIQPEA